MPPATRLDERKRQRGDGRRGRQRAAGSAAMAVAAGSARREAGEVLVAISSA